jgi:hypothetical protein
MGAGGGTTTGHGPGLGDEFVARWYQSEKRARRMRREFEQPDVPQPWSGSPADYQDATAGGRGGEMDKLLARTPRSWKDMDGHAPVGARPSPAPGGLSGGAAKIPAMAGV